jgi:hypothetical protein
MRKFSLWTLIGGVLLGAAACASSGTSSTSGAPPASNVTGRWAGNWEFEPSSAGNGQAVVNLTQNGSQVKGNIETLSGPHRGRAGFFNGIMSGNDIQITGPDATGWLKVSGNEMTGLINGVLPARLTLRKTQ